MTDYLEEQENEIEALQAIYPDEFQDKGGDPRKIILHLVPFQEEDRNMVKAELEITYTPHYPDDVPTISMTSTKGLRKSDCNKIKEQLDELAEENMGMPMVFTLASSLQEWLADYNEECKQRLSQEDKEREEAQEAMKELEEKRKEDEKLSRYTENEVVGGTPVTRESFANWKESFMKEREKWKIQNPRPTNRKHSKYTGKELFMQRGDGMGEPEKPKSAYRFFFDERKEQFKKEESKLTDESMSKKIEKEWKNITEKEKKKFIKMEEEDGKRYEREITEFRSKISK